MSSKDRPGGLLEIPDSLGRDVDRFAQGKGEAPPVEAFLSDSTLAEIEKATQAAAAPLPASSLIPITAGEAAARRTQSGEQLPKMPAPRRVVPPPFQRPRISAGSHGKAWQGARADQVREGDIVPDVGLVIYADEKVLYDEVAGVRTAVSTRVVLAGKGGVVRVYHPSLLLQVFREAVPQE